MDVRDVKVTDEDGSVPQHDDVARDGSLTRQTTSENGRTPEENKNWFIWFEIPCRLVEGSQHEHSVARGHETRSV